MLLNYGRLSNEENFVTVTIINTYNDRKLILTGILAAGKTPSELAPVLRFRALLLLPSTFPSDSGNPNSSPTLKPFVMAK